MKEAEKHDLEYVTGILQKEIVVVEGKLKGEVSEESRADLVKQMTLLKYSQHLLRRCFEYQISPRAIWRRIPEPQHMWSEYRLLEDFDTDNQADWHELPDIRPAGGDVLIS